MSTSNTVVSTREPIIISDEIDHFVDAKDGKKYACAGIIINLAYTPLVALVVGLGFGVDFFHGLFGTLGIMAVSFVFVNSYRMKKTAVRFINDARLTSNEKEALMDAVSKSARFPFGKYVKLSTSTVIESDDCYKDEDRYYQRDVVSATHNLEKGLYFTPFTLSLRKTVTPMVTTVWDDALNAAKKVHFGR